MPLYDYDCANCGRRFEVMHGVFADDPSACPLCGGGPIRKAINAPAVHFKGSGWAKKERNSSATRRSATAAGDDGPSASSGSSGDSPAADSGTDGSGGPGGSGGDASPGKDVTPAQDRSDATTADTSKPKTKTTPKAD